MAQAGPAQKLKLFISYSRRDMGFADRLVEALAARGFDVRIDRRNRPKLEDWRHELLHLIQQADTVVLIVSNESLASPIVSWEVEQVRLYGKRLAPVVISELLHPSVPAEISRINYVFFRAPDRFDLDVDELAAALKTDIGWLKQHTRLTELALHWANQNKIEDALIRGTDLTEAEAWAAHRPPDMLAVSALQQEFLHAARAAQSQRTTREALQRKRRRQMASALLLLIAASAGYAGWSNRPYLRSRLAGIVDTMHHAALTAEAERALRPMDTFSECEGCPEMRVVPTGTFMMGSPGTDPDRTPTELPYHQVIIARRFAISRFAITFDQWDACVALGGCANEPSDLGFGRGSRPVINVDWRDAQQFVSWLARRTGRPYRLLTEAEWEYAARAGAQTRYPWGDAIGENKADCRKCGSAFDDRATAPVGSFAPNTFGLYDMAGNVWQWVQDCWHGTYDGAPADGSAWATNCADNSLFVLRGGSWDDDPKDVRSASRFGPGVSARTRVNGIRIGRSLQQ